METERLILHPATADDLSALIRGDAARMGVYERYAPGYLEFPDALTSMLDLLNAGELPEWWSYLFITRGGKTLIGMGGYKGAPNADGMVEIGYGIAPEVRGQGYASEAALGLIQNAFADPRVRVVSAHTLAEMNASVAVLGKVGMRHVADILDPDDGAIWRWEVRRADFS